MSNNDPINLGLVLVIAETENAICVTESGISSEPFWVPQSQVHDESEVWKDGDQGDLVVNRWFAEKQGWV